MSRRATRLQRLPNGASSAMTYAIARWCLYYERRLARARGHLAWFREHGIAADRWAQRLGAAVALVQREYRCPHYADSRYCPDPTCQARRT